MPAERCMSEMMRHHHVQSCAYEIFTLVRHSAQCWAHGKSTCHTKCRALQLMHLGCCSPATLHNELLISMHVVATLFAGTARTS